MQVIHVRRANENQLIKKNRKRCSLPVLMFFETAYITILINLSGTTIILRGVLPSRWR